ncbi:MAG: hypothetical protein DCO95_12250 [Roseivirga sp. XM-24bin3]|nr:MAG: hypothetical protein DCO95_12250 [Roseivirga sp. XM-24bin3]
MYCINRQQGKRFGLCFGHVIPDLIGDLFNLPTIQRRVFKKWKRRWKEELITAFNPKLRDLWEEIDGFN